MQVLLDEQTIRARIEELGRQIRAEYGAGTPIHLVTVLKGAFMFAADLVRALGSPATCDFIAVSSYGARTKSSGEVKLMKDLDQPVNGRHVIIVEDIVDTGLTLHYLQDMIRSREAASVKTACLLSKPSRRKIDVTVEYVGFTIEDKFVIGFGLDYNEQYRNLPFIGIYDGDAGH
jgi:hypoxanthine phosphoribosyltransferase